MPDLLDPGALRSLEKLCFAQPLTGLMPLRQEIRQEMERQECESPVSYPHQKFRMFWEKGFSRPARLRLLFRVKRKGAVYA